MITRSTMSVSGPDGEQQEIAAANGWRDFYRVDPETGEILERETYSGESVTIGQIKDWIGKRETEAEFPFPSATAFESDGRRLNFIPAPELQIIVEELIERDGRFVHLQTLGVDVHWKRKGGRAFGAASLTSGKLALHTDAAFQLWIAADNCRVNNLSPHQMEALIFHELLHCEVHEDKPVMRQHEWEGFAEEINQYGLWFTGMQRIGAAVKQLELFDDEEED
jgi:hypothetical protein